MSYTPLAPLTQAVVDVCKTVLPRVGRGEAPKDPNMTDESLIYPYIVVNRLYLPGFRMDGPFLSDAQADLENMFQVLWVGSWAAQVEALADAGRAKLLSTPLSAPGFRVLDVRFESFGTVYRDDDLRPPVWSIADALIVQTTPA